MDLSVIFSNINSIQAVFIIVVLLLTILIAMYFRKRHDQSILKITKRAKVDATQYKFLKHLFTALIYLIGISVIIYTIPPLRTLSVSILAGAGVLAVIIGFASQQAFANIISGIFIVIFKPFRVGDRIKVGSDVLGKVEDLTLRHTIIRTYENKAVVIPNAIISNEKIENFDIGDSKICRFVDFSISYDSDVDKAMKIMREEAMKHPNFIDVRSDEEKKNKEPAVAVRVMGYGDSSVNLRAWVWAEHPGKAFTMGCDLNVNIKKSFDKEGIEIPFPYRTIVYKKDIQNKRKRR